MLAKSCLAWIIVMVSMFAAMPGTAAGPGKDATGSALDRCLATPAKASTAGQTACEAVAARSYDRRMNIAYNTLQRQLSAPAAAQLRRSQRAWLAYRDAEELTRQAIYATREGTMYVPMQSANETTVIGDRAKLLERYVRVMRIG